MKSLLAKLSLGFGGLLTIVLAVSLLSIIVLARYSRALERVFRENYESAVYCNEIKESLDGLNSRAQTLLWSEPADAKDSDEATGIRRFETNLNLQLGNCTLPGELELTRHIADLWKDYKSSYQQFDAAGDARREVYRKNLLPQYQELKRLAQQIADMNMSNMVSLDGQAKRTVVDTRRRLLILVAAATLLAAVLVAAVGATVLQPLKTLTRSARQIATGNLDSNMPIRSRDEIGQLTEAFNSMTSRLREFRRLDSDRLARTQQTTQLAIDSLPDAVVVIGLDGKVEISNRPAQCFFKVAPGLHVADMGLKWLSEITGKVLSTGLAVEPQGYASAIQIFEGSKERFLLPRGVPMLDLKGQPIGVAVILVDITLLRHADELKSGFVSTVSHELRTPLTALRMAVGLLKGEKVGQLTPRQKTLVETAEDTSERLYVIIENLLNISRIESGKAPVELCRMPAEDVVNSALEPMREGFAQKQLRLETEIEPEIPDVIADATFIGYALTNLLSNALKFTPARGVVGITVRELNREVAFTVSDTGPGIPDQYGSRVFEKFFRVSKNDGPSGVGLGLAIAKEIVEMHGGRISFRPREGGGCEFTFTLPAAVNSSASVVTP
jgi:signal transduction histidine kinase